MLINIIIVIVIVMEKSSVEDRTSFAILFKKYNKRV
jgi:hypothetical protein